MDSRYITKEKCLEEIKIIHKIYGKVTKKELRLYGVISYDTIQRRFGSITNALELLGINPSNGQRKMVSKEEVANDVIEVKNKIGYISKPVYEKYGKYNVKVINRLFNGFSEMYKELGLSRHSSGYIPSEEELIQDIIDLNQEHGMVTANIIKNFGKFSTTTYHERFGSINNAYKAAGLIERKSGQSSHANWVINRFSKIIGEEPIFEKRFEWLRNPLTNRILPVDAYFPNSNIIIEYNGPQHYKVDNMYTSTEEKLAYRKNLDKIKYKMIEDKKIKLIVVHYKDVVSNDYIKNRIRA